MGPGIDFMVNQHFDEIDAEFALTEGGGAMLEAGKVTASSRSRRPRRCRAASDWSSTARPATARCRALDNALVHLSAAVAKLGAWETPIRLNETTRAYFEKLAAHQPAGERRSLPRTAGPGPRAQRSPDTWPNTSRALLDAAHLGRADDAEGRVPDERHSIRSGSDDRHPRAAG